VGQYLLAWEEYAQQFAPDYVTIFVAMLHMQRTINRYEYGAFSGTAANRLWVRPTFRVDGDKLIREPAQDFERFMSAQDELVRTKFGEDRSRRRTMFISAVYVRDAVNRFRARLNIGAAKATPVAPPPAPSDEELLAVNLKIIEELGHAVARTHGKLVVLDATQYFRKEDRAISAVLEQVSREDGFGYVPVYRPLLDAGVATRWSHDGHLNEAGNRILAQSVFDWIARDSQRR
jgi:hypothetical protein